MWLSQFPKRVVSGHKCSQKSLRRKEQAALTVSVPVQMHCGAGVVMGVNMLCHEETSTGVKTELHFVGDNSLEVMADSLIGIWSPRTQ